MNKQNMISEIQAMSQLMGTLLNRAKIRFTVPEDIEELKVELIRPGYQWLETVFMGPFANVRRIWDLLPEEMWHRYDLWGDCDDHREVILLKETIKQFRYAMNNRPVLFNKAKLGKVRKADDKEKRNKANLDKSERVLRSVEQGKGSRSKEHEAVE